MVGAVGPAGAPWRRSRGRARRGGTRRLRGASAARGGRRIDSGHAASRPGWDDDQWDAAVGRLQDRGWLDPGGGLTELGRDRRAAIEGATDRLAAAPWASLGRSGFDRFAQAMAPSYAAIAAGTLIPYPNPMGLTAPTT